MTKDCRTLGEYIAHAKKYGWKLDYEPDCDLGMYGIIMQKENGDFVFVKLLCKGKGVYVVR